MACCTSSRDPYFLWSANDGPANIPRSLQLARNELPHVLQRRRIIGSRRAAASRPGASVLRVLPHRDCPTSTRRRPAQHLTRSTGVRGEVVDVQWTDTAHLQRTTCRGARDPQTCGEPNVSTMNAIDPRRPSPQYRRGMMAGGHASDPCSACVHSHSAAPAKPSGSPFSSYLLPYIMARTDCVCPFVL